MGSQWGLLKDLGIADDISDWFEILELGWHGVVLGLDFKFLFLIETT